MVLSTSKLSSDRSQRDQLQTRIIGVGSQRLLLLLGKAFLTLSRLACIPVVGKNGDVEAHCQPEAKESGRKYMQSNFIYTW